MATAAASQDLLIREFSELLSPPSLTSMDALVQDFNTALEESTTSNAATPPAATTTVAAGDGRRKAWRRRCKSTSNLLQSQQNQGQQQNQQQEQLISDDSSSSEEFHRMSSSRCGGIGGIGDRIGGTSSLQLTDDSDEEDFLTMRNNSHQNHHSRTKIKRQRGTSDVSANVRKTEHGSDSAVNEPCPQLRPQTKRKRKFKRMALDPGEQQHQQQQSTSAGIRGKIPTLQKRKKVRSKSGSYSTSDLLSSASVTATMITTAMNPNSSKIVIPGKRKRSNREKSVETEQLPKFSYLRYNQQQQQQQQQHQQQQQQQQQPMDCDDNNEDDNSSSSLSSTTSSSDYSEDDLEDEQRGEGGGLEKFPLRRMRRQFEDTGREADDEQSDWPGGYDGVYLTEDDDDESSSSNLSAFFSGGLQAFQTLSATARQAYMARMKCLAECVPGREIRAGTRKLRNRQEGFTIKSSSSEQLSRFLQDPNRNELKLTVLRTADRNKIVHLANLYSLSLRYEGSNLLVLTKTGKTVKVNEFIVPGTPAKNPIDFKRPRRTPPNSPNLLEGDHTPPLPPLQQPLPLSPLPPTPLPPPPALHLPSTIEMEKGGIVLGGEISSVSRPESPSLSPATKRKLKYSGSQSN